MMDTVLNFDGPNLIGSIQAHDSDGNQRSLY